MAKDIDPNAAADLDSGIFGLPYSYEDSQMIFVPVPWEATTSYGGGTAYGPQAILDASKQIDIFDLEIDQPYKAGLYSIPIDASIFELNERAKVLAQALSIDHTNALSEKLNTWVYEQTRAIFNDKKIPAIIGGDHSVPYGAFKAVTEAVGSFGILHFDAHSDTRNAYMGFKHSHASIMYNAATDFAKISKFVQVGIRDFCEEEFNFTQKQKDRFHVFYDHDITQSKLSGEAFHILVNKIVSTLPDQVWISFDIDGLDPRFCPHTGTPVPGGLDYAEAIQIIRSVVRAGKKIIGFDVVEVAPKLDDSGSPATLNPTPINRAADEWDANVGMRLIYKIAAFTLVSQKKAAWRV